MESEVARQRLDKWLWFSRLVKTRALAVELITQGYVRVDGKRAEQSARLVGAGNVLTIAFERRVVVLEILGLAERRGPYREASRLYRLIDEAEGAAPLRKSRQI
ncbi:RNA-binding S4 domain-containing protein [uncultured Rhodoblastus sp.]|uniref:RNA-binding S4 domain-containing protein n=1 Tax=uncultured Rhodoblastus sp. TaxID=543037 RepID=UPI0025D6FC69|nr:RNA-binding S4 domain-containing protein [uncultured Rhodoblastus sp.]